MGNPTTPSTTARVSIESIATIFGSPAQDDDTFKRLFNNNLKPVYTAHADLSMVACQDWKILHGTPGRGGQAFGYLPIINHFAWLSGMTYGVCGGIKGIVLYKSKASHTVIPDSPLEFQNKAKQPVRDPGSAE